MMHYNPYNEYAGDEEIHMSHLVYVDSGIGVRDECPCT
jgi:hypothetical protein